ncbi:MAG: rhodanese-like domain-containing protein [Chloroflexi bacterium]|nr:rhodanese-like domain-containing protein [Chloroflexota bacterium]
MSRSRTGQKSIPRRKHRKGWGWLAGIGLVVLAAVVIPSLLADAPLPEGTPAEVSVTEAYRKYSEGVFVLDVRTIEEWDEFHIPGTTLIPLDELPTRLDELPAGVEIVVVCRSGNRSQQGRDILAAAGFDEVSSMAGGVNAWRSAGYPVEP